MRSAEFLDTLGVNTHVNSYPYDDTARIVEALNYIGFKNVRQSSPIDESSFSGILALGQAGARIDLIINGGGPVDLDSAMQNVYRLAPYLNAVENVNEAAIYPISYGGLSGIDAAVALQKDLYRAVRADPSLDEVPVYSFTIGGADPDAYPSIGDISDYTDYANIHSYPPHGLRPIFVIHAAVAGGRTDAPSKPVVLTETGYYTLTNGVGWGGVPESLQASYLLDEVLDEAAAGLARTYLYDLLDDGPDPQGINQEAHFGLFHEDGSPKLAATAFHNLTALLADPGATSRSFQPSSFGFTASGLPYDYTGNSILLDKSDGSHVIAIWNEEQLWDTDRLVALSAQHFPVSVDLHRSFQTVLVFDPLLGTDPIQTLHDVDHVQLDVTDHPFLIQVMPDAPPSAPSSTPDATSAPATGTIVVHVSEDAYRGDARFQLTVDGAAVGGEQTAMASHAAGLSQAFILHGPAGVQPSQIGITFLNDAWDGTPSTDRNLYVDGVTVDGIDQPHAARTLLSNGTVTVDTGQPLELSFDLSETAWDGDAVALLSVDGQQLGGAVTVTADHLLGQTQRVSFLLPLGTGAHTATVTFTNDAYGGTPQTDRNLFVDAITLDGAALADAAATLTNDGARTFAIPPLGGTTPFVTEAGAISMFVPFG